MILTYARKRKNPPGVANCSLPIEYLGSVELNRAKVQVKNFTLYLLGWKEWLGNHAEGSSRKGEDQPSTWVMISSFNRRCDDTIRATQAHHER